ncbi:hypothetical protein MDA_GLEAN10017466 [Myotis davidii]|uniref:Uncharacterized protein n=1 Tax=Myotis davidii TaxID=225400 RepID=L5LB99_MYODS|nr:hypothetical protein MDA_GLEAN10017466 [Myotis davidii]
MFVKVGAERGGRGSPPRSESRRGGEGRATIVSPTSGAESGKTEKSHRDLGKPQGQDRDGNLPTRAWSRHSPSSIGKPPQAGRPHAATALGDGDQEIMGGFTEQPISGFSLQDTRHLRPLDLLS